MLKVNHPNINIDFTHILPCVSNNWHTPTHQLRWIPTKLAHKDTFLSKVSRYAQAGIDLSLVQAPNNLWYLAEPRGSILVRSVFPHLDLDFRLYILFKISERLQKLHSHGLIHGGFNHPTASLSKDGAVYLHGIEPVSNQSRSEDITQFAQYVSRQLAIHAPNMTTKQHTNLAASSLRVLLNEGCAGNLSATGGLKLLSQSLSLLLPSTQQILQRRLSHVLSNQAKSRNHKRLSVKLDKLLSKRYYPQSDKNPTLAIVEEGATSEPLSVDFKFHLTEELENERVEPSVETVKPRPTENVKETTTADKITAPPLQFNSSPEILYPQTKKTLPPFFFLAAGLVGISLLYFVIPTANKESANSIESPSVISNATPIQSNTVSEEAPDLSLTKKSETETVLKREIMVPQDPIPDPASVKKTSSKKRLKSPAIQIPRPRLDHANASNVKQTPIVPKGESETPSKTGLELTFESTNSSTMNEDTNSLTAQNIVPVVDLSFEEQAQTGQIVLNDIIAFQNVSLDDPLYTSNHTLLLMNAQAKGNQRQIRETVRALMQKPENTKNPYLLLAAANSALHDDDYTTALSLLQQARSFIPSPMPTDFNGHWQEVFAATLTGLYIIQAPNTTHAEVIASWYKVSSFAEENQQLERLDRSKQMIDRLSRQAQ